MLSSSITALRATASGSPADRAALVRKALAAADALMMVAVDALADGDFVAAASGLPAEFYLGLEARRTRSEASGLMQIGSTLRKMPLTAALARRGVISFNQLRLIVSAARILPARLLGDLDGFIDDHAPGLVNADPDELIWAVELKAGDLQPARLQSDEQKLIDRSYLFVQPDFDGGARLSGRADPESAATIIEALDHASGLPENANDVDATPRSVQHFDALLAICEQSLAGESASTVRPRPRLLATVDIDALNGKAVDGSTRLLWNLPGTSPRLSRISTEMMMCDANLVAVVFDGSRPVMVGDTQSTDFRPKVRTAIIARDGGCRFPGCKAPAGWADAHHIVPGVGNTADDGILLCRRCHRRVHHERWKIFFGVDGAVLFRRGASTYTSLPRHRAPPAA